MLILLMNHQLVPEQSSTDSSVYRLLIRWVTAVSEFAQPCSHSQPQDYITGFSVKYVHLHYIKKKKKTSISYCFILLSLVCNFLVMELICLHQFLQSISFGSCRWSGHTRNMNRVPTTHSWADIIYWCRSTFCLNCWCLSVCVFSIAEHNGS